MVLVIGLVAAVSIIGLAYIDGNSVTMQSSFNLCRASRARYVAESGVEQAIYWLSNARPPGANPEGYWPGASDQRVDESPDYYDVAVVRDAVDRSRFKITSTG